MATITVGGNTYKLVDEYTWREMSTLKRVGGVLPKHLAAALDDGDPDVVVALALISIQRVNPDFTADDLYALPMDGGILIEAEPEDVAVPLDAPVDAATVETASA